MKKVKITVMRITRYEDLISLYENPIENACCMKEGQTFICEDENIPAGMCEAAWETLLPFVKDLLSGKGHFYGNWMKDPFSAMVSCNDGFRPVTFYLELEKD